MTANIGTADRVIRFILGLAILAVGFYFRSWWGLVGLLPILTAVIRFCPAYVPFHVSTCAAPKDAAPPAQS